MHQKPVTKTPRATFADGVNEDPEAFLKKLTACLTEKLILKIYMIS